MRVFYFSVPLEKVLEILETVDDEDNFSDEDGDIPRAADISSIILFPPKDGDITDEDSDDDDEANLNHLTPAQLIADVEVVHTDRANEATASVRPNKITPVTTGNKKRKLRQWQSSKEFSKDVPEPVEKEIIVERSWSAVETWESVFSNDIFTLLVEMSNNYALQRNHHLNVTLEEMKVYVAILLLTGYMTPKNIRMYWEIKQDVHNQAVADAMRRNRFLEIHQYLHTCDNLHLLPNDKFAKLESYFSRLNKSFLKNFEKVFSREIAIDETMVPYYGRHSCKQHIHGKPIRFGYKLWSACTRAGYLVQFIPYQGSKAAQLPDQPNYGLGAAVVLQLLSTFPQEKSYNLFFDNFFTGLPLLDRLTELGHFGTGTVRENRTEKCPLDEQKAMKKMGRGAMCMRVTSDIAIVRWNDNSIVTLASNACGIDPQTSVIRVASVNKKRMKIFVQSPNVVTKYNTFMGGVDRFDQNVESERIAFRGKKWWYPLFAFGVDAACQTAWKLYQAINQETTSYCGFRRSIVQAYLGKYKTPPKRSTACGSASSSRVHDFVRTDNCVNEHVKEQCSHAHCAHCQKRTRIQCKKRQVPLHVKCWYAFHNK